MGQTVGRMPETWDELMEERDRVLYWSGEILSKVDENITNEDTFLMDYDNEKIDGKVLKWINKNKDNVTEVIRRYPNAKDDCKNQMTTGIDKITDEMKAKMRKDYQSAYSDIKKFTKKVDQLGAEERKLHEEIQKLEGETKGDVKKFQKKFGPLRVKVFNNLVTGEKFQFEDKRLKTDFTKKVYDVDKKNESECAKKFEKMIKDFEKCASKK